MELNRFSSSVQKYWMPTRSISGISSGQILANAGNAGSITVAGAPGLVGGSGQYGGYISVSGALGKLTLAHDLTGGSGEYTGYVEVGSNLSKLTIGGSVTNIGEEAFEWCGMLTNISVAAGNPDYAGVMASFASVGDLILAEPKAMIGFAGARVLKETTRQDLPKGFQTAEFLLERGLIDRIIPRLEMRAELGKLLNYLGHHASSRHSHRTEDSGHHESHQAHHNGHAHAKRHTPAAKA